MDDSEQRFSLLELDEKRKRKEHSVLQSWVFTLPFRMQSVLMSALRGCDTARKDDASKFITRALRGLILNNADPTNTFIVGTIPDEKYVTSWLWDLDSYPLHFVMHTAHAAEIVGFKHPDEKIRTWWIDFYRKLIKGLHVNPENEDQLNVRLGFTPAEEEAIVSEAPFPPVYNDRERLLEAEIASLKEKLSDSRNLAESAVKLASDAERRADELASRWDAGTGTSHGGRDRVYSGGS